MTFTWEDICSLWKVDTEM